MSSGSWLVPTQPRHGGNDTVSVCASRAQGGSAQPPVGISAAGPAPDEDPGDANNSEGGPSVVRSFMPD